MSSSVKAHSRTATPALNSDIWRHSAALDEFAPPFMNGRRRSVNRKVQGSSPCPGAKLSHQVQRLTPWANTIV